MLRVLAVYEEGDLPIIDTPDPVFAASLGLLPGVNADEVYALRWDPMPKNAVTDLGWIGEDGDGVWLCRHPRVALLDYPRLWDVCTEWRYGQHDLDFENGSAFEVRAKAVMISAKQRAMDARLKNSGSA